MAYKETYHRAFNSILNKVLSFPTLGSCHWTSEFSSGSLKVGDLVSLNAVHPNDWQLSWVEEIAGDRYLLRSSMTGELCWWSNVGFSVLKDSEIRTEFQWTDRQFGFRDKFLRAIKRNFDYSATYGGCEFDGFKVTCYLRKRFDFAEPEEQFRESKSFPDFRKVKASDLNTFYLETSKKLEENK